MPPKALMTDFETKFWTLETTDVGEGIIHLCNTFEFSCKLGSHRPRSFTDLRTEVSVTTGSYVHPLPNLGPGRSRPRGRLPYYHILNRWLLFKYSSSSRWRWDADTGCVRLLSTSLSDWIGRRRTVTPIRAKLSIIHRKINNNILPRCCALSHFCIGVAAS
jgi:hypothetical protein